MGWREVGADKWMVYVKLSSSVLAQMFVVMVYDYVNDVAIIKKYGFFIQYGNNVPEEDVAYQTNTLIVKKMVPCKTKVPTMYNCLM